MGKGKQEVKQTSTTYICNRCGAKSPSAFEEFLIDDTDNTRWVPAPMSPEYPTFNFHLCPTCLRAPNPIDKSKFTKWVHPPTSEF